MQHIRRNRWRAYLNLKPIYEHMCLPLYIFICLFFTSNVCVGCSLFRFESSHISDKQKLPSFNRQKQKKDAFVSTTFCIKHNIVINRHLNIFHLFWERITCNVFFILNMITSSSLIKRECLVLNVFSIFFTKMSNEVGSKQNLVMVKTKPGMW